VRDERLWATAKPAINKWRRSDALRRRGVGVARASLWNIHLDETAFCALLLRKMPWRVALRPAWRRRREKSGGSSLWRYEGGEYAAAAPGGMSAARVFMC